jgi:two-component system NtrC family sensor kinase
VRRLLPENLAPRLIVSVTILLVVVEGVFGYFNYSVEKRQLRESVVRSADQLSRSLISATWQAMLSDRKESAYRVMETMGQRQGVDRIRLVNADGDVTFTTDPGVADDTPRFATEGPPRARARFFETGGGQSRLGLATPIFNEPSCRTAACHAHPPDRDVLGVMDVVLDTGPLDAELAGIKRRGLLLGLTHFVAIAVFLALFTRFVVAKPIRELIGATKAIRDGDLDRPLSATPAGELGELAEAFDAMRGRLRIARDEIEAFAHGLEEKVERRSRQLDQTRRKLIQSDRLASLGQLSASVAHEINNPIGAVVNLSLLMQRIMNDGGVPEGREEEFRGYLGQVAEETQRVGRIVSDLLSFSRRSAPQRNPADLNQIVVRTVSLVRHKLALANVEPELALDRALPAVPCDRSQIEQVILNLVMNAAEAMPDGGRVIVRTRTDDGSARLEVADEGMGIDAEALPRIFEPFFTTKAEGKGVGLGLAVVYGIIEAHGGTLDVDSRLGQGTVFTAHLPLHAPAPEST